jgi:hypothetical protein
MSETVRGIMPVNALGEPVELAWPADNELFPQRFVSDRTLDAVLQALGIAEDVACGRDPVQAARQLASCVDAQCEEIARLSDKLARIRGLCTHQKPLIAEKLGTARYIVNGKAVIDVIDGRSP